MQIYKGISYNQISLIPKFSKVSRKECDTSVKLGDHKFDLPIIPANMKCTIDNKIALDCYFSDIFHIMHRFCNPKDAYLKYTSSLYRDKRIYMHDFASYASMSVGIKPEDFDFVDWYHGHSTAVPIKYITIDVAHGHHARVIKMIYHIKNRKWNSYEHTPFVIAGNIATPEAVIDLEKAGADATKIGISYGAACTTYEKTGFSSPMFSTIQKCAAVATKPIIADGGIRTNGDIAKALVAGATMVMAGSLFAQCIDSPAETIIPFNTHNIITRLTQKTNYKYKKKYFGSASVYNKNHNNNVEGRMVILEGNNMNYLEKIREIKQDLQSAISYSGGNCLNDLISTKYNII